MKRIVMLVVSGLSMMICNSCQKTSGNTSGKTLVTPPRDKITLMTLDPGHFHAALVQKSMYPQVDANVYVYAPEGSDVKDHLGRIDAYNKRAENPTRWNEIVYTGPDYLDKFLAEKKGNVVVLSGNNRKKTEYIKTCVDASLNVLADKPMCIDSKGYELLAAAFESAQKNNVLLYDVMTERYEITSILQKELAQTPEVFGTLKPGSETDPSIVKESVHNFYKIVSGKPLKRPGWFYDSTQQGEGLVDVTTHLVDLAMWEAFPDEIIDYAKDVQMISSTRWPTMLTKEQYRKSTQLDEFPEYLQGNVNDKGMLACYSNGQMIFTLRGIHTKVSVTWDFEAPEGGGDTHYSVMKGTKASVIILQGAQQNYKPELYVEPAEGVSPEQLGGVLFNTAIKLQSKFPGVMVLKENNRWKLAIPDSYRVGHEAHFAQVTEKYLKFLAEGSMPRWEVPNMLTKYQITTQALSMAKTILPEVK